MTAPISITVNDLLETPGADRVVFIWVDPKSGQRCHTDIVPGECVDDALPSLANELYLVGRFHLQGYGGSVTVTDAINNLRTREGLDPLPLEMFSRLHADPSGNWFGAIKIQTPTLLAC